jgi:energy-coupling factor transport system permease protein
VDFNRGNLIQKVKSVIPILIPLFASSFKRADALATAMEARGYQGGEGRTKYRVLEWKLRYLCCYCHDITRCNTLCTKSA